MIKADKIESHYRQQLSALMDGALSPDEARFLVRRLQHDVELAQCLDRWHMAGDALRGEAQAILPAGFAERVAAAIADQPAPIPAIASRANRGGLRWAGGAALAASVALAALFATRQPASLDAAETSSSVAARASAPRAPTAAISAPAVPVAAAPTPRVVTESVATASSPQRNTIRPGTRAQSQRATIRTPARSERPLVAATSQVDTSSGNGVFAADASRPWPSAVLPQTAAAGRIVVDYGRAGDGSASSPSFYPFEPRLPDAQREGTEPESVNDAVAPPP